MMDLPSSQKNTILIIDDDTQNLKVMVGFLKESGFEISVARSGEDALKLVEHFTPDIILLDVMMPGLNGFETCGRLKANKITQNIPVIFMTALTDVENKVKGLETGAVDFVTKPVEYREVIARITTHLTLGNLQKQLREKNTQLEQKNLELEEKNRQLQEALDNIKTLSGLLPICANCKKIRDDDGYWHDVAVYVRDHSDAEFTHGICPDCLKILYPDYFNE